MGSYSDSPERPQNQGIMQVTTIEVKWIALNKGCIASMSVFKMEKLTLGNITHFPQWNSAIFFSQTF